MPVVSLTGTTQLMRIRLFALLFPAVALSQAPAAIQLIGPLGVERTIRPADIASLPQRTIRAAAHGVAGTFQGVPLGEVLRLVGMKSGDSLRGPALASYVLVEAADGYRVTFTPADLDAAFTDRLVLLATMKDGAPLAERDGPFQLIVPDEKRPARWVRQVIRIRVVQVPAAAPK